MAQASFLHPLRGLGLGQMEGSWGLGYTFCTSLPLVFRWLFGERRFGFGSSAYGPYMRLERTSDSDLN